MNKAKLLSFMCILLFGVSAIIHSQTNIYVAPDGMDSNTGAISSPLQTLIGARNMVRSIISTSGLPDKGIVVNFRGGVYPVTTTCHMNSADVGTSDKPIVYRGYSNEKVIFDGSIFVDNTKFKPTGPSHAVKLHDNAVGKVYYQVLTDTKLIEALQSNEAQMSINGRMMTVARFPNLGYAHVDQTQIVADSETIRVEGTFKNPKGPRFKIKETFDEAKWQDEISRTKRVTAKGYISAQWLKETITVVSGFSGNLHLKDGTRYGLDHLIRLRRPNRLFITQILCELDEPGEWYFDKTDNTLYVWPDGVEIDESRIGIWAGPMMVQLKGSHHVHFTHMTIQNLGVGVNGDAAIDMRSGSNLFIAGVIFRNIAQPLTAFNTVDATNSTILSCDFIDNFGSSRLYGGSYNSTGNIVLGNNKIENCHFTRVYSKDFDAKATFLKGIGNIFRNNLVHNILVEPVSHEGLDHFIGYNEIFNVGIEEGDDGAITTGNNIRNYGNVIKHNFIHHIMDVPTLYGRAGVMCDDYDGGEIIEQNVMYKGGGDGGVKMNRGAGHSVLGNVLLDCGMGIKQSDGGSSTYINSMKYINSTDGKSPTSGDKENYFGRMLKEIGIPGWSVDLNEDNWIERIEPFWMAKYPVFKDAMTAYFTTKQQNTYECRFYDNLLWSNDKGNIFPGSAEVLRNREVDLSIFTDPSVLNFKFKEPRPSYAPDIPFEEIGLYLDEYRCAIPDKDVYRSAIRQRFDGQECYGGDYDPATINQRLYYNSGKFVHSLVTCGEDESLNATLNSTSNITEGALSEIIYTVVLNKINNTGRDITFGFDDLGTGTAISGIDYVAIADDAKITVQNGANTGTFTVPIIDDNEVEMVETINMKIGNPNYAYVVIKSSTKPVSIIDDESILAELSVTRNGSEDTPTSIIYTVALNKSNSTGAEITFDLKDIGAGSANKGEDYLAIPDNAKIVVADGSKLGTYTIETIDDDILEESETILLEISNPDNSRVLITNSRDTATIIDDDIVKASLSVANNGNEDIPVNVVFSVTLSALNQSGSDISFDFTDLENGTAIGQFDYIEVADNTKVVVNNDSLVGTFEIEVISGSDPFHFESINVEIHNPSDERVYIDEYAATGYILDNAQPSLVTVGDESRINIYPNPVKDFLILNTHDDLYGISEVQITDCLANTITYKSSPDKEIDVSNLTPGLYFICIKYNNRIITRKFIKL